MRVSIAVVVVALAGCGKPTSSEHKAEPPAAVKRGFQIGVYTEKRDEPEAMISFKGKPIDTVKKTQPYVAIELDDSIRFSDRNNGLTATLDTTCGKVDVPLALQYESRAAEDKARADFKSDGNYVVLDAPTAPFARLLIDNVGGKATQVAVGDRVIDVPVNDTWVGYVRTGPCAQGRTVKIAGVEVGTLTAPTETAPMPGGGSVTRSTTQLIDVKGGNCYRWREHIYSDQAVNEGRKPDQTFKGARIYSVEQVMDFLTDPPQQIKTVVAGEPSINVANTQSRYELNRCAGTPKR